MKDEGRYLRFSICDLRSPVTFSLDRSLRQAETRVVARVPTGISIRDSTGSDYKSGLLWTPSLLLGFLPAAATFRKKTMKR